jgi:hypothetical protein
MKLKDRVKVTSVIRNCEGVSFKGQVGTIIGNKVTKWAVGSATSWLVLFDKDICGLSGIQNCDHNFLARSIDVLSNGCYGSGRNQRFFLTDYLLPLTLETFETVSVSPKNNDNRSTCFWCAAPTKRVFGFNNHYDVCTRCLK